MLKILNTGDIHIRLHVKKVPYDWQKNRFFMFFDELLMLEKIHDVTIISGDIFDKKPEPDEITLLLSYLNRVTKPTYLIPGNHEATNKGDTFLKFFADDYAIENPNVHFITKNERMVINDVWFQFFPYNEMQINNLPNYHEGDILVTHIRGEVPPHITAEYDFENLRPWKLVLISDLHFSHKYKNFPIYYAGSPMNVVFDRDNSRQYGVNSIWFNSIDDYEVKFIDCKLPKLIRKTISVDEKMVKDEYNHVIYEVTGSIDNLAKIQHSELLDKKIAHRIEDTSVLNLKNKSVDQELEEYLNYIKIDNVADIMKLYRNMNIT